MAWGEATQRIQTSDRSVDRLTLQPINGDVALRVDYRLVVHLVHQHYALGRWSGHGSDRMDWSRPGLCRQPTAWSGTWSVSQQLDRGTGDQQAARGWPDRTHSPVPSQSPPKFRSCADVGKSLHYLNTLEGSSPNDSNSAPLGSFRRLISTSWCFHLWVWT